MKEKRLAFALAITTALGANACGNDIKLLDCQKDPSSKSERTIPLVTGTSTMIDGVGYTGRGNGAFEFNPSIPVVVQSENDKNNLFSSEHVTVNADNSISYTRFGVLYEISGSRAKDGFTDLNIKAKCLPNPNPTPSVLPSHS